MSTATDFLLRDQVALVTGGSSGIGRACALALAGAGARVVVADLNVDGGQETVALIAAAGGEATFIATNVADATSVDELIASIVTRYGRLDCALNNAGIESPIASFADSAESDWDRVLTVNLKSVWLCMRAELRQMLKQGGGAIVNTSSVGGLVAVPGNAIYSAAKHGVIGLTRTAAVEYAGQNIRVNAICPGLTLSGMTERLMKAAPDLVKSLLPPMQRFAEPSEISGMVLFLCSPLASYLSGQAIAIDGAATAV